MGLAGEWLELHPPIERICAVISAGTDDVLACTDAVRDYLAAQPGRIHFQARFDVLGAPKRQALVSSRRSSGAGVAGELKAGLLAAGTPLCDLA